MLLYFLAVIGFVHDLSPLKVAKKSGVKYYDMTLQLTDGNRRAVCFNHSEEPRHQLEEYALKKSPVKINNLKRTLNKRFNTTEYHVTKYTKFEPTDIDSFGYIEQVGTPDSPVVKISDILNLDKRETVSIIVFCELQGRPIVTTSSKYNSDPVHKREVKVNDDSGTIKLSIWDELAVTIGNSNRVFKFTNLSATCPARNVVVLNTTKRSKAVPDDTVIRASEVNLPDLVVNEYKLPATNLNINKFFECGNCNKDFINTNSNPNLVECNHCHNRTLERFAKFYYQAVINVCNQHGVSTKINMYRHQFVTYFKLKGKKSIPSNEEEVVLTLLSDESSTVLCNSRNTCIGFKHL